MQRGTGPRRYYPPGTYGPGRPPLRWQNSYRPARSSCYGPVDRSLPGGRMRWITASLALAVSLLGCAIRGEQVPLITDEAVSGSGCVLMYQIVDVMADPTSGTVIKGSGEPLRWPKGYTARRVGSEVQVLDRAARVVLTTGSRYWMCPAIYLPHWVVGEVRPCPPVGIFVGERPFECELGSGVM